MRSSTATLASALRILAGDIQSPDNIPAICLMEAADRLAELQRLNDSMQTDRDLWIKVGREKLQAAEKERDEARAEVARLKDELHDTIESYKLSNLQPKTTRPEPSRLEIAARLKAGWFANRDADFNAADHGWWIEQADKLIAAAREAK